MTDNVPAAPVTPAADPPASTAPAPAPAPEQQWYGGFQSAELRGLAELKGWASPEAAVESYQHMEKLHGVPADRILKLPRDENDKAGWDAVYKRLGRPDKAEDYKLPVLEGDNGEFAKAAAQWMHELGIPLKTAQALAAKNNEYLGQMMQGAQKVRTERFASEHKELMREWGEAAEKKTAVVDAVADKLQLTDEQIVALRDSLGPAGTMRLLAGIAERIGEDQFVGADGGGFGNVMSPAAANAKLQELRADQGWVNRYLSGDVAANKEFQDLLRMANPAA